MIGSPNQRIWPDFFKIKSGSKLLDRVNNQYNNLMTISENISKSCLDLLNSMLIWDPVHRISVNYNLLKIFFL
jgi:hypothetical protein